MTLPRRWYWSIACIYSELRGSEENPKLAIIISAWDLVVQEGLTPAEWLNARVPLVAQYIEANKMQWRPIIFGVSAFGGDPGGDVSALLALDNASDRPYVVDEAGRQLDDFTLPIAALLQ